MQLLRASSDHSGKAIDYAAIMGTVGNDVGIPHAELLVGFAEAVLGDDAARLEDSRRALTDALGAQALSDSAGVVGMFNALDRVADSTGIPVEDDKAADTAELRAGLGLDDFAGAAR